MAEPDKMSDNSNDKIMKKNDSNAKNSQQNDNEDADSLDEQPLDIGEHYLVRRSAESWRK